MTFVPRSSDADDHGFLPWTTEDLNNPEDIMTAAIVTPARQGPTPTEAVVDTPITTPAAAPVVALKRRSIDAVLIGFGVVATVVFAVAGGLLTWGHNFSSDYVTKELGSQHVSFPNAAGLTAEGRTDLLQWAGHSVNTGDEAQAYASYINGHLAKVADGSTYADLSAPQTAAKAAVTAATTAGQPAAAVAALQGKVDAITAQRNTLFTGETLRGLLLSAYAWSTVGTIAGLAAIGAFIAAAVMAVLVGLGLVHHRRTPKAA
ncbi:MAG: hypothetical protein JWM34_4316 [Ilumatobacteraceae bacterium]|nr:hypothetical protein [Ilumatobacteraceae bacterium]